MGDNQQPAYDDLIAAARKVLAANALDPVGKDGRSRVGLEFIRACHDLRDALTALDCPPHDDPRAFWEANATDQERGLRTIMTSKKKGGGLGVLDTGRYDYVLDAVVPRDDLLASTPGAS